MEEADQGVDDGKNKCGACRNPGPANRGAIICTIDIKIM